MYCLFSQRVAEYYTVLSSVAEPHHFDAVPATVKNLNTALSPTLLETALTKRAEVNLTAETFLTMIRNIYNGVLHCICGLRSNEMFQFATFFEILPC
jgi:hypothetical protein